MMTTEKIPTDKLLNVLRVYMADLSNEDSPFPRDTAYLRNLAGWIACAATRIENLAKTHPNANLGS